MLRSFGHIYRSSMIYIWVLSLLAIATFVAAQEQGGCYAEATIEIKIEEVVTFALDVDSASSSASTHAPSPGSAAHSTSLSSSAYSSLSSTQLPVPTPSSGYVFNSQSARNIAVYFGQTAATSGTSLAKQCADPSIDIVILGFVISRNYSGGLYPGVNFGAACSGQTSLMEEEAPGLLSCPGLAADIDTCQTVHGKKVLLSIGGGGQSIIFETASDASAFGRIIWDLFGPQGKLDPGLRPFGSASIDGFDIGKWLPLLS